MKNQRGELIVIPARPSFCTPGSYWDGLASQTKYSPADLCILEPFKGTLYCIVVMS